MHLKTEKTLKTLSSGQKYKKNQKTQKNQKNPTKKTTGLVFFIKKPGFFPTLPCDARTETSTP
jgi:hypothetical protein